MTGTFGTIPDNTSGPVPLMRPQPGDFAVCSVGGDLGKLIEAGEWLNGDAFDQYQHAYILIGYDPPGSGRIRVVQAEPGGASVARMLSIHAQAEVLWSTGAVDLTGPQRRYIVSAAIRYSQANDGHGVGYSWLDYVALGAHRLHIPAPGLRGFIASTKTMICSQLVDQCYRDAGVQLFDDKRWAGYVTPADLAARIETGLGND